jgi:Flp pilus assembly protein TadG
MRQALLGEDGQTMTEFAIVLVPLVLLIVGLVQVGVAVNFWQDQQRLANQGARFAIVNCNTASGNNVCTPSLEAFLESQTLSNGNNPNATVCFRSKSGPSGTTAITGDPVSVRVEAPFSFVPIVPIGSVTLSAESTMRLERDPTHPGISTAPVCP